MFFANNFSNDEEEDTIMEAMFDWDLKLVKKLLVQSPERATDVLSTFFDQCMDATVDDYCDQDITKVDTIKFDDEEKEFFKLLLDHGADVNGTMQYGWERYKIETSYFSFACRFADLDTVRLMMEHGADLDFKDEWGFYPIQHTFKSGKLDKMNIFFERGIKCEDINGLSLLNCYVSSKFAMIDMVEILLQLGANIVNHEVQSESTLNRAVQGGNLQIVQLLLANGAGIVKFNDEYNELCTAVQMENIDIVRVLLQLVVNYSRMKRYALYEAVKVGSPEIVQLLLDSGAKFDNWADYGPGETSPINYAAANGHQELLEFFINRGFAYDESLLTSAIKCGELEIVQLLIPKCFDVNVMCPRDSATALCIAVREGIKDVVEFLLDQGARMDDGRSRDGYPLHYAATDDHERSHNRQILQLLLDRGADINVEHEGHTPLSMIGDRVTNDESFMRAMTLVGRVVIMKSQNLHVSEVNLKFIEENDELKEYRVACESEIKLLKGQLGQMVDGSRLSYYDVLTTNNNYGLAAMATEKNIVKFKQIDFENEFPIYGQMVVVRFYTGILTKSNLESIWEFFNYLCARETDKLPKLPYSFTCELFKYLSLEDVHNLSQLIN